MDMVGDVRGLLLGVSIHSHPPQDNGGPAV